MQKLTAQQVKRLQVVTNMIQNYYANRTSEGRFSFSIEVLESSGDVMLSATNLNDSRWFDTHYYCTVVIGKRGGIFSYRGTLAPKLMLPATPRLCEYIDPFKRSK